MAHSAEDTGALRIWRVGEVLAGLRGLLEERVGRLWVVGEVSGLHRARSGHVYFTLKDEAGQIRAALFRSASRRLLFEPEDGLEVLVYGEVTVYEPRGELQLVVRQLEPRGQGALQLAFEQLRRRLEAEGLFDPARKRRLPAIPVRLGLVTSPDGAALHDVLEVSGRRFPSVPLLLAPARVQGAGAEQEIAQALAALGAEGGVDLILLVRGGGSLEDLQAFNSEAVARAIAASPVPVLSGVGHEVDVTIADLVADARAPTPSAAAEQALPDRASLRASLRRDWRRLCRAAETGLARERAGLERERDALRALAPAARLAAQRVRFEAALRALARSGAARVDQRARVLALARALLRAAPQRARRARARWLAASARLDSLSPLAVLARGYALVRRVRDDALLRSARDAVPGEAIAVRLAEGELEASVTRVRPRPPGASN